MNTPIPSKTLSPKTFPKLPLLRNRHRRLVIRSWSASPADVDSDTSSAPSLLERCFAAPAAPPSASGNINPVMKGKYGAFGAVTLEKGKLEVLQQQSNKSAPEVCLISFFLSSLELGFLVFILFFQFSFWLFLVELKKTLNTWIMLFVFTVQLVEHVFDFLFLL